MNGLRGVSFGPGPGLARRLAPAALAAVGLLAGNSAPAGVQAQVAQPAVVMAGSYQNFDVLNNTGEPAEGFEMDVDGIDSSQLTRIFPSNFNPSVIRYGLGTATNYQGGVAVRWAATYDAAKGAWSTATPVPPSLSTVPGESCWTVGMPGTYQTAGCEHFGISSTVNPTRISYHWLVADPANPGTLVKSDALVAVPAPAWVAQPPADPGLPPVVQAVVQAPPAAQPARYGDAEWVKVYKTEHQGKIELEQLMGDNHQVVPEEAAEVEVGWSLLQADPAIGGGNKRQKGKLANGGNVGNGNHAVVRRYEYYAYSGAYDPLTHEALCADGTCSAPGPGELGNAIGAQNAGANLNVNALTVTTTGGGQVASADRVFSCGAKCYGVYTPGSSVTLTAKASSGSTFAGWSGACAGEGQNPSCTVTLNAESTVGASFVGTHTLSVSVSNSGTVSSAPAGIDCGRTCSAKFSDGTTLALTAVPPAGKSFVSWSGACTGADPTACSVTINGDTKVQATFSK